MLRKTAVAIAAAMLVSGAAVAAQDSPFPASPNETGVYQPEPYYPPVADSVNSTAAPLAAQDSPFPASPNETGVYQPEPYVAPAARVATHEFGSPAQAAQAEKIVHVGPSVKYANVSHMGSVRIVNDQGQSFVWRFDTVDETHFPVKAIEPAGFDGGNTVIYVTHPYSHMISG